MQVDYNKYPEIPSGCQMNLNKKTGVYQVFREGKKRSPWCTTKRESVGRITPDGKFTLSKNFELQRTLHEIKIRDQDIDSEQSADVRKVVQAIDAIANSSGLKEVVRPRSVSLTALLLGALMQALTGDTDCVSIGDFISRNKDFFNRYLPECPFENVSHDTVRRSLMLIEPAAFEKFYVQTIYPLTCKAVQRVIAADGQAVRASGRSTQDDESVHSPTMFMSFYDTSNRVCIAQKRIDKKTNEISVGPQMIDALDLRGCVVTADAMSCQVGFVEAIYKTGDYCISLKGNQETVWKEAMHLFATTHSDQIKVWSSDPDLDHGRIEQSRVSMIRGALLSEVILAKWPGLRGGAIVRVERNSTKKSTNRTSVEERFYITSLPALEENVSQVAEIIRAHWAVENNLHWMLDNLFRQDRMQADNPNYMTNRCALNKLALACLEDYRYFLWNNRGAPKDLSIHLLQQRCRDPKIAIECIGCALRCITV